MSKAIKAVVFDIDNTLTEDVSWLKTTELLGASVSAHADIFARFSAGEVPYLEAKRQLIQLWQETGNVQKSFWVEMFRDWPLKSDAQDLVDYVQSSGYTVSLITGSFDLFAEAIARELGITSWYANTNLLWDVEGKLIDFDYVADQAAEKAAHFQDFVTHQGITAQNCVVVGDGVNDMELFKITQRGIAVGRNNQDLLDIAWHTVDDLAEIKGILARSAED